MKLTSENLTIHIGDKVSFKTATNEGDQVYLTGIVAGVVPDNRLTARVVVNDFLMCTIAVKEIARVNNLFINLRNFNKHINLSIAL